MKIAMLGAGAMGSLFGGLLAEGGHDVTLVDANAAHVDAPPELVIVFTKTLLTRAALAAARELGVAVPHVRTAVAARQADRRAGRVTAAGRRSGRA